MDSPSPRLTLQTFIHAVISSHMMLPPDMWRALKLTLQEVLMLLLVVVVLLIEIRKLRKEHARKSKHFHKQHAFIVSSE